jgi:hypothetical protein
VEAVFDEGDAPTDEDDGEERYSLNFKCRYQASVMNTFEIVSRGTVSWVPLRKESYGE